MIGERLKNLRENLGMNRKAFADHLGVPYSTYYNYEIEARDVNSDFLITAAQKCDVSADYLLGLTDSMASAANNKINDFEFHMVSKYRSLDDYGKEVVDLVLDKELQRSREEVVSTITLTAEEIKALPLQKRIEIEKYLDRDSKLAVARRRR